MARNPGVTECNNGTHTSWLFVQHKCPTLLFLYESKGSILPECSIDTMVCNEWQDNNSEYMCSLSTLDSDSACFRTVSQVTVWTLGKLNAHCVVVTGSYFFSLLHVLRPSKLMIAENIERVGYDRNCPYDCNIYVPPYACNGCNALNGSKDGTSSETCP